jgi:hypothetical protein
MPREDGTFEVQRRSHVALITCGDPFRDSGIRPSTYVMTAVITYAHHRLNRHSLRCSWLRRTTYTPSINGSLLLSRRSVRTDFTDHRPTALSRAGVCSRPTAALQPASRRNATFARAQTTLQVHAQPTFSSARRTEALAQVSIECTSSLNTRSISTPIRAASRQAAAADHLNDV